MQDLIIYTLDQIIVVALLPLRNLTILLQAIRYGKITYEEALNKMTNIRGVIKRFDNLDSFYQNQAKVL